MSIRVGDLAVVVQGLWANVGRVVYVCGYVDAHDFTAMGLKISPGWRVRTWSPAPLEMAIGERRSVGYTPAGSLRPLEPLPSEQHRALKREMARADWNDAMRDLDMIFRRELVLETALFQRIEALPINGPPAKVDLVKIDLPPEPQFAIQCHAAAAACGSTNSTNATPATAPPMWAS